MKKMWLSLLLPTCLILVVVSQPASFVSTKTVPASGEPRAVVEDPVQGDVALPAPTSVPEDASVIFLTENKVPKVVQGLQQLERLWGTLHFEGDFDRKAWTPIAVELNEALKESDGTPSLLEVILCEVRA